MLPSNELLSNQSRCRTVQSPIPSGITADNWFPDKKRLLRFPKLPTLDESGPDSELYDKSKLLERTGRLKISLGIEPFRWFIDRSRANRFFNLPMLDGIGPSKLQWCASRKVNIEIFPIDEGI